MNCENCKAASYCTEEGSNPEQCDEYEKTWRSNNMKKIKEEVNEYDKQAEDFCKKWGVKTIILEAFPDTAPWDLHNLRHHYRIKISRGKKRFTFDFYGSINDYQNRRDPYEIRPYEYLACLDIYEYQATLGDFLENHGYVITDDETYRLYITMYEKTNDLAIKLIQLFPEEEARQELSEIV